MNEEFSEINERRLIRNYKREHYNLETERALESFIFWLKDGDFKTAFYKIQKTYGYIVYAQVCYLLNNKINN